LTTFLHVADASVGWYILAFAVGNFLGPLTLGRLFDTVGRRVMIAGTYLISGIGLVIAGYFFTTGSYSALSLTVVLSVIFFFASAGASGAYLTVSVAFPLEIRAHAIAFFYAIGSALGGLIGPALFGKLVETGDQGNMFIGYAIGGALMIIGGLMEIFMGIDAEQKSLEEVAEPISEEAAKGDGRKGA
ncbi:MAG: MFS transporter, partial [Actinomycetota bacterium]